MKNHSTFVKASFIIIGIFLVSCESHEQNVDAFEVLKNEKLNSSEVKDTVIQITDTVFIAKNNSQVNTKEPVVKVDEFNLFKVQTEQKISSNELKIKELKSKKNISAKASRTIISYEKDNNNLRQLMVNYIQEEKVRWATFKAEINQEVSTITLGLKDAEISN
jgi:hypothetical protein